MEKMSSETFAAFLVEVEKAKNGNKAAGVRARKLSLDIEKQLKAFRKESMEW